MAVPAGTLHSIQDLEGGDCEFLLVFNQGSFSEGSTFPPSDWLMRTPPHVPEKNFRLGSDPIAKLLKDEPRHIFPGDLPRQTLAQDVAKVA